MPKKGHKKRNKKEKKSKKSKSDKGHDRKETDDVGPASHSEQGTFDGAIPRRSSSKKEQGKLKSRERKTRETTSDNAQSKSSAKDSTEPSVVPGEPDTNSDADRSSSRIDKAAQCQIKDDCVQSSETSSDSGQQNTSVGKQQVPNVATEIKGIKKTTESTKLKQVDICNLCTTTTVQLIDQCSLCKPVIIFIKRLFTYDFYTYWLQGCQIT